MIRLITPAALLLAGCAAVPPAGVPLSGQWGGPHIGLRIEASGTAIEYDCAAGAIPGPIVPDGGGRFTVEGTHTPEHGGPMREGEVLPTYRAQFTGRVQGDRMTLSGQVENGVLLGPFALRREAEPGNLRCL